MTLLFTDLEDRRVELERHKENSSRMAEAVVSFMTTGQGSLEFPRRQSFGVVFIEKPIVSYGCEIDLDALDELLDTDSSLSNTPPMPHVSGYVTDWEQDRRGYYVGAYCGAKVTYPLVQTLDGGVFGVKPEVDIKARIEVVHHFRFTAVAMKDVPTDITS